MNYELIGFKTMSSNTLVNLKIDLPDECPYCNQGISPKISTKTEYNDKLNLNVGILYQCPTCKKYFSREYLVDKDFDVRISGKNTRLIKYDVLKKVSYDLPSEIDIVSKPFKEIYMQSLLAESEGLDLISGIGYRKSIEFLIKDFLINYQDQDSEQIAKLPLAQAIGKIENKKIQNLSKATTWLGNDETHYQRKFDDKDVSDMKRFIKALTFYISSEIVADEASDFINS